VAVKSTHKHFPLIITCPNNSWSKSLRGQTIREETCSGGYASHRGGFARFTNNQVRLNPTLNQQSDSHALFSQVNENLATGVGTGKFNANKE
jgi:hypothetical protein